MPSDWSVRDKISRVVEDDPYSGRRCLSIDDPDNKTGSDVLSARTPVAAGKRYVVRLRCRAAPDATPGGLGVYPRFWDADGREFGKAREQQCRRLPSAPGAWTFTAFQVQPPDGAVRMAVWLHTFSSAVGNYRVDDVELLESTAADLLALVSWNGAVAEPAPDGSVVTRWEHARSGSIDLRFSPPADWTPWSALEFTLESGVATGSAFMLIITSENTETDGSDYFSFKIKLDWTGPRTFLLPFRELGIARRPIGWNKIDRIAFTAGGWGNTPDPRAVVTLRNPRLTRIRQTGPTMTDEDFFAALDLDRPELAAVKRDVARKDWKAAIHDFAEHVRSRTSPRWRIDWRDAPFRGVKVPPPEADRAPDQWDYFSTFIKVDWTGWKHFVLKKSAFSPKAFVEGKGWKGKKPIGWNWITYLAVNAKGWGLTPDPETVLYFDDIRLTGPDKQTLITDFEDPEDHDFTRIERTTEFAHSGKWSGKWWNMPVNTGIRRTRLPHDWTAYDALEFWAYAPKATGARLVLVLDSDPPKRPKRAEDLIRKKFTWRYGNQSWPIQFKDKIDWHANPTSGPGRTHLWNEALNRHFHFRDLSAAYWNTGQERYARALAEHWMDWIHANPPPRLSSGNGAGDANCIWQTLTTGIRLENTWPDALYRCLGSPSFTDRVIIDIVKSIADQARHLVRWPSGGNWLTEESLGLFTAGMLFPEYREAASWRQTAVQRLYGQLDDEVYPDGMEYELATGYNNWVVSNLSGLLDRADMNGLRAELPKDYLAKLEKMYDYLLLVMMPNGKAPGLNDSGDSDVRRALEHGWKLYPDRTDFLFGATLGKQGTEPRNTSHAFPYAGHYVMRSDWGPEALYLLFDSGPFGYGHQHEDKLHFVLFAYGRRLVLDPGNYSYDHSKWRRYVIGTAGHNTIMVDGQGQNRRAHPDTRFWPRPWTAPTPPANDTLWTSTAVADFARGTYRRGYGPKPQINVTHTRRILFIKPEYFLIVDTLRPADSAPHRYDALFHLDAENAELTPDTLVVRTREKEKANVGILPLKVPGLDCRIVKGQEDPVQGWSNGPWRPVPTAVYTRTAAGTVWFAWVLQPIPANASDAGNSLPTLRQLPADSANPDGLALKVRFPDGRDDTVLVNDAPQGRPLEAAGLQTTAELLWVRRGTPGGAASRRFEAQGRRVVAAP